MSRSNIIRGIFLLLILPLLILQGCWDAIEIDDRAIILGMAIDVSKEDPESFEVTLEIANPQALLPDGGDGEGSFNLSFTGKTILEATRNIYTQTEKTPTYEHIQAIIVGEGAAQKGFDTFFDFMVREVEIRRRTDVLVAVGTAKDVLENLKPKIAPTKSTYIRSVLEKERFTGLFPSELHIGTVIEHIRGRRDFILARIEVVGEDGKVEGAAVISNYKLIGWLEPHEIECVKMVRGTLNNALVTVELPKETGRDVAFEIMGTSPNIEFNIEGKVLKGIQIHINIEGDIGEVKSIETDTLSEDFIKVVEAAVKEKILKNCNSVVHKSQRVLKADVFDFGERLMYRESKYWRENRDRWSEIYSQVPITFNIDVKVRRIGLVR